MSFVFLLARIDWGGVGRMRPIKLLAILILFVAATVVAMGCRAFPKKTSVPSPQQRSGQEKKTSGLRADKDYPKPSTELKLYFPDTQAQYLVLEKREVSTEVDPEEESIRQLIKGPRSESLRGVLPAGTKLLSLKISGDTAYVDFSSELIKNHPGGSAGETMTIYSVVDTLAQFAGITKVKFLVEGKSVETLAGHYDLMRPFEPRWDLVRD
jgi:spore germination protein GerM